MAKSKRWLWLLVLLFLVFGAPAFFLLKDLTFSAKKLTEKNPVSYAFHAAIAQVRRAIESSYHLPVDDDRLYGGWYPSRMSGHGSPETEFDLFQDGSTKSDIYHWLNVPLAYKAEFKLRLAPLSNSMTQVDVQTAESMVLIGPNLFGHGGDFYQPVAPTTVEEYRILLKIGRSLNEPNMPPLKVPK
jgi:hypothetical protein